MPIKEKPGGTGHNAFRAFHSTITKAPHSIEAELSILGGLILDNSAWPDVSAIVQRNDFHEEKNRIIFSAIRDLAAAGKPFDPVTLIDELERNGRLAEAGGATWIGQTARDTPSAANVSHYAVIVRRCSLERQIKVAADNDDYSRLPELLDALKQLEHADDRRPVELPRLPRVDLSLDDLTIEPPEPPFLIECYMPRDVQALIGTGGTGKSTLDILQGIHLILGRPLWDMSILAPGPVVYVTAEDGEDRLKWRLFHIVNQLGLTRSERQKVADNFHIVNLVGTGRKLVAQDRDENLVITPLADQIIEEFQAIAPVRVSFDPMVKFGPGERMVNDGEDMLVNAGHRITQNLHCATNFTHHVSKDVARNAIVDHHSGRGGSALGDGVRAAYQLLTITPDIVRKYPGAEIHQSDITNGRLLAFHITKLTDARCPLEPIILRRNGWLFEPVSLPGPSEVESATQAARQQAANRNLKTVVAYLKERRFLKLSRRDLEGMYQDIGISRNNLRAAIIRGLKVDQVLVEMDLPEEERHGGKQTYITVAGDSQ